MNHVSHVMINLLRPINVQTNNICFCIWRRRTQT